MFGEVEWVAQKQLKVGWFRPEAGDLKISGRRLDAPAPPLVVEVGSGAEYRHRFSPSLMTFPTAGRWHIGARVGRKEAHFVVLIKGG